MPEMIVKRIRENSFSNVCRKVERNKRKLVFEQLWRSTQAGRRDTPGKGAGR